MCESDWFFYISYFKSVTRVCLAEKNSLHFQTALISCPINGTCQSGCSFGWTGHKCEQRECNVKRFMILFYEKD